MDLAETESFDYYNHYFDCYIYTRKRYSAAGLVSAASRSHRTTVWTFWLAGETKNLQKKLKNRVPHGMQGSDEISLFYVIKVEIVASDHHSPTYPP